MEPICSHGHYTIGCKWCDEALVSDLEDEYQRHMAASTEADDQQRRADAVDAAISAALAQNRRPDRGAGAR